MNPAKVIVIIKTDATKAAIGAETVIPDEYSTSNTTSSGDDKMRSGRDNAE
jgi:hypothetical protein